MSNLEWLFQTPFGLLIRVTKILINYSVCSSSHIQHSMFDVHFLFQLRSMFHHPDSVRIEIETPFKCWYVITHDKKARRDQQPNRRS